MTIFIVEDDPVIAQALADTFSRYNYDTYIVTDFEAILSDFNRQSPDLVIMDVNLPVYNGFYWCQHIRKHSTVPIIFLSSITEHMDMMTAMQMGADDYLTKPIELSLLVMKTQALLRRTYDYTITHQQFIFGDIVLDGDQATLTYHDSTISLTFTELQILKALFLNKDAYVKREELLNYCWENEQFIDDNTLAVNISRIRKKLSTLHLNNLIQTKKKVGYRLYID